MSPSDPPVAAPTPETPKEDESEEPMFRLKDLPGNWHAIEGPNGMCACGPDEGCPERLARFIRRQIDFWHAKACFLERERDRTLDELPDAFQRVNGSLAMKVAAYREFVKPFLEGVAAPTPETPPHWQTLLAEELREHNWQSPDISYCWWCQCDVNGVNEPEEPHDVDCWGVRAATLLAGAVSHPQPEVKTKGGS